MFGNSHDLEQWLDHVIKQSLVDTENSFSTHYLSKHGNTDNLNSAWTQIINDEVIPITQKLFDESEQEAPSASRCVLM